MKVKSESEVAQLSPTLRNPMDCGLPGSSVPGIFQGLFICKFFFFFFSKYIQVVLVVKNLPARFRKIPWRRAWQPTSVFLPGEFHGQRQPDGLQSMGSIRVGHD